MRHNNCSTNNNRSKMNKNFITKGQMALHRNKGKFEIQTQAELEDGMIQTTEGYVLVRSSILNHAGIKRYLDETTEKKTGITNMNGNKLPKGFNLAVEKIRLGYAFAAAASGLDNPAKVTEYKNLSDANIPAALRNADLVIIQDGKDVLRVPVAAMLKSAASDKTGKEDSYEVDNPPILYENKPIGIEIEYPDGEAVPNADFHYIEILLLGARTAQRI